MNDIEMSTQQPPKGASEASSSALGLTLSAQSHGQGQQQHPTVHKTGRHYMPLLIVNYLCLFVGSVSSSLLSKYYFIHKGSSRWVSTWVQSTGFPLLLPPIYLPYWLNYTERRPFTEFTLKLLAFSLFVGLCLGVNNLLFSWGNSYLPVSTSSLLLSTQLVFNLILSVVIVKQKVTFSNLNCVILLTLSCVLLALGSSHDRPEGLTQANDGEDLPEGLLLCDGDGDATRDGGGGLSPGNGGHGVRWRGRGDEDRGGTHVRPGPLGLRGDGVLQRGDLAALLHGDGRDDIPDVRSDWRDLHDGAAGHERGGWGCRVRGRLWWG
ncbi:probable purine permease 4 isoform X2 [Punica granatum]|uniref:Probable purine permease n=1 Tax=Punica granatum TaxID=22663 RepID=A0A6P8D8B4_PUNGR|nr:probable purine permease 4 isoform X2 [Punica granatum]